jgi:hypothetical protein
VNYNPSDPNDHKVNYGDPLLAAGVLSAVGCCMCCIGTVVILTSQKVKGAAHDVHGGQRRTTRAEELSHENKARVRIRRYVLVATVLQ